MEILLRRLADKRVSHCRAECGEVLSKTDVLLVKSFGDITYYDKSGQYKTGKGNHYIHFHDECLKNYDTVQTGRFYGASEQFAYNKLLLSPASKAQMPAHEVEYLKNMGVQI